MQEGEFALKSVAVPVLVAIHAFRRKTRSPMIQRNKTAPHFLQRETRKLSLRLYMFATVRLNHILLVFAGGLWWERTARMTMVDSYVDRLDRRVSRSFQPETDSEAVSGSFFGRRLWLPCFRSYDRQKSWVFPESAKIRHQATGFAQGSQSKVHWAS